MTPPVFDHHSPHDPHATQKRTAAAARSTWVSVGVNLVLSVLQVVVGIQAKSQALVADGLHSFTDLVADFVVLFANHHAAKEPDEEHPYGHHRFETAASLMLGLLLLGVGVGMVWSAVTKVQNPGALQQVHVVARSSRASPLPQALVRTAAVGTPAAAPPPHPGAAAAPRQWRGPW